MGERVTVRMLAGALGSLGFIPTPYYPGPRVVVPSPERSNYGAKGKKNSRANRKKR